MKNVLPVVLALSAGSVASAQVVFTALLEGSQEVPPVSTPASGSATLTINPVSGAYTLDINFTGLLAPVTVAHIHRGAAGTNGPIIIWLDGMEPAGRPGVTPIIPVGSTSFSGVLSGVFPAAEIPTLIATNTYINIHTSRFPGGELRGQLIPTPAAAAVLALGGLLATRRRRAR